MQDYQKIYSYHTFLLPFTWAREKWGDIHSFFQKKQSNIADDEPNAGQPKSCWNCLDDEFHELLKNKSNLDIKQKYGQDFYMEFQFFNEASRHILYNYQNSNMVHNYEIRPELLTDACYEIQVGEDVYVIKLDRIRLKIFNTGIAVFYMDCSNREPNQFSLKAVKAINEYGRRISLSFWPDKTGYKKCADCLRITGWEGAQKENMEDDFRQFIAEAEKDTASYISLTYISKIIRSFLNLNEQGVKFRAKDTDSAGRTQLKTEDAAKQIRIWPILDGKMYVSCLIVEPAFMGELQESYCEEENCFREKETQALVELINVDLDGECSIAGQNARGELLQEALYLNHFSNRAKQNRVLAITADSCIKIIETENYEIAYHTQIYNQLLIFGLIQRMAIVNFQQEVAKISYGIEKPDYKLTNRLIFKIMELQERFVAFESQFMLSEVTPQREGQYIYRRIREVLAIEQEQNNLSNSLSSLYELANINQGYGFNKGALIISVIALVYAMFTGLVDASDVVELFGNGYSGYPVIAIEWGLIALCIFVIMKCIYRK